MPEHGWHEAEGEAQNASYREQSNSCSKQVGYEKRQAMLNERSGSCTCRKLLGVLCRSSPT